MADKQNFSSLFGLRLFTICVLALVLAAPALCGCSAAQGAAAPQAKPSPTPKQIEVESRMVIGVRVKGSEDREVNITLHPCKGETPGKVLGVSEEVEVPGRVAAFVNKLRDTDPKQGTTRALSRGAGAGHDGRCGRSGR